MSVSAAPIFVFSMMLCTLASAGMSTALLRAVGSLGELDSLRSVQDLSTQTLRALDSNRDGRVDPGEVAALAHKEGFDPTSATEDFSDLDSNGDGVLDSAELLQVLRGGGLLANTTAQDAASGTKSPLAATKQAAPAKVQPQVIKGSASEKPTPKRTAKHEPQISIQDTKPSQILKAEKDTRAPQPSHPQLSTKATQAPQVTAAIKPAPVERMVRHFAQVLRTAEVLPLHLEKLKLTTTVAPSMDGDASSVAETSPSKLQSAAKEVSEQLFIAQSAAARARVLDRISAQERANATVLARLTAQEALNAGATAAHSKATNLMVRIAKLEDQAERAQVRSAALHSKAKLETEEASELMEVADRALNHSPPQPL